MDKINYNITNLSIDDGLSNYPISAGKNYLILLEAPTNANVTVRLNNNTSDEIPLDKNFALKFPKSTQIYISADTVTGETIKIGTSASLVDVADFEIIPAPVIDSIDTITTVNAVSEIKNFSSALLTELDKKINPYGHPTLDGGHGNSTSEVTLVNKTLTCDKIKITLGGVDLTGNQIYSGTKIHAFIDSKLVASFASYDTAGLGGNNSNTIENVNGLNLTIKGSIEWVDADDKYFWHTQEYTLKT